MTLVLAVAPVASARAAELRFDNVAGQPPASVSLIADDATGIEGFELTVAYDPAATGIAGAVGRSALTENCLLVTNSATAGEVRVVLACLHPLHGVGPLLTFPLAAQHSGSGALAITHCRVNEAPAEHPTDGRCGWQVGAIADAGLPPD